MTTKDGLNRTHNITEPIGMTTANFRCLRMDGVEEVVYAVQYKVQTSTTV